MFEFSLASYEVGVLDGWLPCVRRRQHKRRLAARVRQALLAASNHGDITTDPFDHFGSHIAIASDEPSSVPGFGHGMAQAQQGR